MGNVNTAISIVDCNRGWWENDRHGCGGMWLGRCRPYCWLSKPGGNLKGLFIYF